MAIPFRVEHFQFQRQSELQSELQESVLYRRISELHSWEGMRHKLWEDLAPIFRIPPGTIPELDGAVYRVKTVTRLPYEFELHLCRPGKFTSSIGFLEDRTVHVIFSSSAINGPSPLVPIYHIATSTFRAFQTAALHGCLLLWKQTALAVEDRMRLAELWRLADYAADCFAVICCDSTDLVLREDARAALGAYRSRADRSILARAPMLT